MGDISKRVGRPPKWETPEQVQKLIDAYFESTPEKEWTVTGLALALDTYRDVLIRYEAKDEFYNTIKKAKEKVHNSYEKDLRKQGRSGDIFALKNFGWSDRQEHEHSGPGGTPLFLPSEILNRNGISTDRPNGSAEDNRE